MFYRHLIGDLALAVLLALPLSALAEAQPPRHPENAKSPASIALAAERVPDGRISLLG